MARYKGEQICPFRLSHIVNGNNIALYDEVKDLIRVRNSSYTSNDGYALGDIAQTGLDSRTGMSAASALVWLKIFYGQATQEQVEKGRIIREEIASALYDLDASIGSSTESDAENQFNVSHSLLKDLDVQLIHEALIQRFDKQSTYLSESMGDINALLEYTLPWFQAPNISYSLGDIDMDGEITNTAWYVGSMTSNYDQYLGMNENGQSVTISISEFVVTEDGVKQASGFRFDGPQNTISNTSTDTVWRVGGTVTGRFEDPYGYYAPEFESIYMPDVKLFPGDVIDLTDYGMRAHTPQVWFRGLQVQVLSYYILDLEAGKDGGDTNHWIRHASDYFSYNQYRRYKQIQRYVHQNYDTFKPLVYSSIYMSSRRARTARLTGVGPRYQSVWVHADTSFTTDFKYIKKDPNGQFLAGGMARCPAFAGQSSNGVIPDNNKIGFGYLMPCQAWNAIAGPVRPNNVPYTWDTSASTSYWNFYANIPEEIVLPTPLSGGALLSDSQGYTGAGNVLQHPNLDTVTLALSCPTRLVYYTQKRTSASSSSAQTLARFGSFRGTTTIFGNGHILSSNTANYIWFNSNNNTLYIIPNLWNFAVERVNAIQATEFYIPVGYLKIEISDVYADLISKPVSGRASFSSVQALVQARLNAAGKSGESWNVAVDWQSAGLYAQIPPTNFDFSETV